MEKKNPVDAKISEMTEKKEAFLDGNRYTDAMYAKGYADGIQWALDHTFDIILDNLPILGEEGCEKAVFFKSDKNADEILCEDEDKLNHLADALDAMGFVAVTGYYDPKIDKRNNEVDDLTGLYHLSVD